MKILTINEQFFVSGASESECVQQCKDEADGVIQDVLEYIGDSANSAAVEINKIVDK